jgi:hypothetical protein
VPPHFGDSTRELTTSRPSSMKKGGSNINGSDLNTDNIIKPTFNTLMEVDCKALEAYHAEVDALLYSCYEVWPNLSLSFNNVQSMINSALERQAKSSDELMHR